MWNYTPRQLNAFKFIADKRLTKEAATNLSVAMAGARGDPKAVKKQIKKWGQDQ